MRRFTLCLLSTLLLLGPCRADGPKTGDDLNDLTLEQLLQVRVEGAALHPQTLEDAPASVTILTAEDIRKYGYRTLAEALSSVRDFYSDNNRTYTTVGVRGFDLPGDYGSHLLVMVNGHNMTDNIFDYMLFFGTDFPIDMNLIKQIEIIRGPSSALYGSNGIFATINIITKSPEDAGPPTLTAEAGSFGVKKGQITVGTPLGKSGAVLFSGSVFNNSGESPLYFPQFNTPQTNFGKEFNMDGEKGYHFFSTLTWRNWTVTAAFSDHDKIQPISWGPTVFGDRGNWNNDIRNFVDAVYARYLAGGTLRWRTYYDAHYYVGRAEYPLDPLHLANSGVEDNRATMKGDWVGSELRYRFRRNVLGELTVGTELKMDVRNLQENADISPAPIQFLKIDRPDRAFGLLVQDERQLSRRWTLDLGLRYDWSAYRSDFLSPRAGVIWQPSSRWTYKLLYGRSFRNPSAFQLFYDDGLGAAANPAARPEKADTLEFDVDHKLGKRMNLLASAYGYRLNDFLEGVYDSRGLIQYQNVGRITATGISVELNGRPASWLEATASYALQHSDDHDGDGTLFNSPIHLAKLRFAVPLGRRFDVSSGMQYMSPRLSFGQVWVKPVYLADFTLTTKHLLPNLDFRAGVRNTFARSYSDPVALLPSVDSMQQPGRSVFFELIVHGRR